MTLQDVRIALDDGIGGTVGIFIPAVRGTNLDIANHVLHIVYLGKQLVTSEVAAVEGLGSNGDSVDLRLVLA